MCRTYKNPISEFDVGHMSFENRRKDYEAQVVSTTRSGTKGHMDWGFSKKAQF